MSATGDSMQAQVEDRFGRAPYFVIVDSETMRFRVVSNPSVTAARGAGRRAAQLIVEQQASVVLTGRIGSKGRSALDESGIEVVEGVTGTVEAAVEAHLRTACGKAGTR